MARKRRFSVFEAECNGFISRPSLRTLVDESTIHEVCKVVADKAVVEGPLGLRNWCAAGDTVPGDWFKDGAILVVMCS